VLNYHVRRTAVDYGVPLITNPNLVAMFAEALEAHAAKLFAGLVPQSLADHYRAEAPSDTWTAPNEFH
jgi:carbamoyl-phosphate synthase (ammonia)